MEVRTASCFIAHKLGFSFSTHKLHAFFFFLLKISLTVMRIESFVRVWCSKFSSILIIIFFFLLWKETRLQSQTHFDSLLANLAFNIWSRCFPQLLKSSEGPVLRRRRHLDSSKPYIAAKLASLPTTFTLGDEKRYNGFYNKPLTSPQEYLCFVLAVLRYEGADSTANYVRGTDIHMHTDEIKLAFTD